MIWELIATLIAGVGAAGIALLLKKLSPTLFPRYLVPVFAGLGMLSFQIYGEYTWLEHQESRLPSGVELVRVVDDESWWRPWRLFVPLQLKFVALDTNTLTPNTEHPGFVLVDLYFFAHREQPRQLKQVIDCKHQQRALYSDQLRLPTSATTAGPEWQKLLAEDLVLQLSCRPLTP